MGLGEAEQTLRIDLLGVFSVRVGGAVLSDGSPRAQRMWTLLKYLITFRQAPVPTDRLIEALWPEESVSDPVKALYTLVYRLRALLGRHFAQRPEFIQFSHGCYQWNKDAPCTVDADRFEALCARGADARLGAEARLTACQEAFELYRGDYLSESAQEAWAMPQSRYYKRLYTELVARLTGLCAQAGGDEAVVNYCGRAAALDPFEESFHIAMIEALLRLGRLSQAAAQYAYISGLLSKELGVEPSDRLKALNEAIHLKGNALQFDIAAIKQQLSGADGQAHGAFFCELPVFRKIFQLEQRALERSGLSIYLMLVTLMTRAQAVPTARQLAAGFPTLKTAVIGSLRGGDVVAQYSDAQLLVLLSGTSFENCEMIMERLRSAFARRSPDPALRLQFSVSLVTARNE